ncbi:RHS repeat-associated core domain-containing protein, partial [Duganella sp. Root198D2]|uniref:RHS repeat-associated core domain-containing protein n=1 Tax=Duganella sp. Root198D2 TaxID=1736489 RepID=UPI0026F45F3F
MFKKLFTAAWTALLLACCQLAAAAPTVNVTATPSNPTVPATVTLAVTATSDGNPVMATQVEYFNGSTSLGASVQAPFTLTLDNLAAGTYQIIAKVATTDPANPILQSAPLAVTVATPPGTATAYFIHTDQLNTPRAITNGGGNLVWQWDSDPFGKDAANEQPAGQPVFTFNQRFPGQQFDRESNLHYNYYRDYDPQTGRYVQSDPIGLEGGINTYAYVG